MAARMEGDDARLLTRTGLDWTAKYASTAAALGALTVENAYIDGELCALDPNGVSSFGLMQAATDQRRTASLVYFAFDLLHLNGEPLLDLSLSKRKARLAALLRGQNGAVRYSDHQVGRGPEFYAGACKLGLEGVMSKRLDAPYAPGDRGLWVKTKCVNREEFIVVGWTDPEGSRPHIGALLLAYYDPAGRLVYAGRVGSGMSDAALRDVWRRLQALAIRETALAVLPPRKSRFGGPLVLSRVHWVRPELVVEVSYLTWTADNLLRQVVYLGVREDKPAREVQRLPPNPDDTPSIQKPPATR